MFGKHVKIRTGEDTVAQVWVWCTPDTPQQELELRAVRQLRAALTNYYGPEAQ